jgi:putative ABC transport system ATP-binding protein
MIATAIHCPMHSSESGSFRNRGCNATTDSHDAQAGTNAIAVNHVAMEFHSGGQRFQALNDINFSLHRGEIQLLMGPSGSGKTTLLSILSGFLTPSAGSVCLLGQDLTRMSRSQLEKFRLQNIGFVFQEFNLFPALTALENVELALSLKGMKGRAARNEAMHLLGQVGLADKARSLPHNLSGGQKQRVAIARALAGNPRIIMADEPTASLDSQSGHMVISLLRQLVKSENRTLVMVTHDPRLVDLADRVAYLEDGQLRTTAPLSAASQWAA